MGISSPWKLFNKEFVITTETKSDSYSGYRIDTVCLIFIAALENGSLRDGILLIFRFSEFSIELFDFFRNSSETSIYFCVVL
jgi:hypothetical protein